MGPRAMRGASTRPWPAISIPSPTHGPRASAATLTSSRAAPVFRAAPLRWTRFRSGPITVLAKPKRLPWNWRWPIGLATPHILQGGLPPIGNVMKAGARACMTASQQWPMRSPQPTSTRWTGFSSGWIRTARCRMLLKPIPMGFSPRTSPHRWSWQPSRMPVAST